jgi:hypothetical protein
MRQIKFRVFKKETGVMYYPDCTQEEYNHYYQIGSGGFWLYNKAGELLCTSIWGDVLMQYTCLKDKNGKEIYEGDIVGKGIGEIFWDDSHKQFQVRWHTPIFKKVRGKDEPLFPSSDKAWQIVGNIHDNPELVNPAVQDGVSINMKDPNVKAEEVSNEQATESAAEDQAMEVDSEEGGTEG